MGFGTTWIIGNESEARLLWEDRFPARRRTINAKFVTSLELQILRCQLQGLAAFDPKVEVCQPAFPKSSDPEFEDWYRTIDVTYGRAIGWVLPDFLTELRRIKPDHITILGSAWGEATDAWWHTEWPDHASGVLGGLVAVAKCAHKKKMGILALEYL